MCANLFFKRVYICGYNVFIQGVDVRVIEDWILFLFNELRTRDKMRGLSNVLSLFRNELYHTGAQILDSINHIILNC